MVASIEEYLFSWLLFTLQLKWLKLALNSHDSLDWFLFALAKHFRISFFNCQISVSRPQYFIGHIFLCIESPRDRIFYRRVRPSDVSRIFTLWEVDVHFRVFFFCNLIGKIQKQETETVISFGDLVAHTFICYKVVQIILVTDKNGEVAHINRIHNISYSRSRT